MLGGGGVGLEACMKHKCTPLYHCKTKNYTKLGKGCCFLTRLSRLASECIFLIFRFWVKRSSAVLKRSRPQVPPTWLRPV